MLAQGCIDVEGSQSLKENPCFEACEYHTLSHTTTVDHEDQTQVAAFRSKCVVYCVTLSPCCVEMRDKDVNMQLSYVEMRKKIVDMQLVYVGIKLNMLICFLCWHATYECWHAK